MIVVKYWMEMVLILMRDFDTYTIGMLWASRKVSIEEVCVVLHSLAVMTMSGLTFCPQVAILSLNG